MKITAIKNRSRIKQSKPKCQPVLSTALGSTSKPPKIIVAVINRIPIKDHFLFLLAMKLIMAKNIAAIIAPVNNIFIDSPVYTSLNAGVVSHSGYLKQITPSREETTKKTEV